MHGTSLRQAADIKPRPHWLTLAALSLAVLVAQVDTAVTNLAVAPIGGYFAAGAAELQWVVDAYNLAYAVLLLSGGLIADLYGRRRVFMAGAATFTLASLVCALAPTVGVLIAGRAVAGVGAALLVPSSLAIIRVAWRDPAERGRALGVWAACNGLAMAIGPTLGGFLIRQFDWRSIFFVVVPLSLVALLLAPLVIPESADPEGRDFDAPAQLLGVAALGGFAFAVIEGSTAPGWALAAVVIAALAAIAFVGVERRKGTAALVPLDLFGRAFRGAGAATVGMTFSMYGALFVVPLFLQRALGFGTIEAGLGLLPLALLFVIMSPFSGTLTKHFGARFTAVGGVAIVGCGLLLIALGAGTNLLSLVAIETGLGLTGLGMGLATGPLMGVAVGAVTAARSGTASAVINVVRMAGATMGVAVLGALFIAAGGGVSALRIAMLLGGVAQLSCAAVAWRSMVAIRP